MATPIGHTLAGCAVGALGDSPSGRGWIGLCAVFAVAPDFDFLPGLLDGEPARFHQGVTHSFAAALATAVVGAAVSSPLGASFARRLVILFFAYSSHLLIDLFGPDGRSPYGIPLLWPLDDRSFLAPFAVFLGVQHAASADTPTAAWLAAVFSWRNILAIGLEIVLVGPFLLWSFSRRRRRDPARRA